MSKHRKLGDRPSVIATGITGAAVIGTGLFAGSLRPAAEPAATPHIKLVSVECSIGDALCAEATTILGAAASGDPRAAASGAVTASAVTPSPQANPIQSFFGYFVGNGTPDHPDAGILVGDGYSFTANDVGTTPYCQAGKSCNGGNAGLIFGNGGNGYDGGTGGNAYNYGHGGNGGDALDLRQPGEPFNGGNGGHGGVNGGTDAAGNLFKAGGGNGGNGINDGNGGNGGDAGWGLDYAVAVVGRLFGQNWGGTSTTDNTILGFNILSFSGTGGKAGNGGDGT